MGRNIVHLTLIILPEFLTAFTHKSEGEGGIPLVKSVLQLIKFSCINSVFPDRLLEVGTLQQGGRERRFSFYQSLRHPSVGFWFLDDNKRENVKPQNHGGETTTTG